MTKEIDMVSGQLRRSCAGPNMFACLIRDNKIAREIDVMIVAASGKLVLGSFRATDLSKSAATIFGYVLYIFELI